METVAGSPSGYTKRKSFAHERELRACTLVSEVARRIRYNLDRFIDAVFVAGVRLVDKGRGRRRR